MRIGILQTAYKKASDYGAFYNVQELGLARALANLGHEVTLYKAVDGDSSEKFECDGRLHIMLISVKYLGINALMNVSVLDSNLDVLVYFCDTQIIVPSVYRWCRKHNVHLYPYIGVIESHSENVIKRTVMRWVAKRDLKIYSKCTVLAKTPDIRTELINKGCSDTILFPVGLDETVMHSAVDEAADRSVSHVRDGGLLYIGRMEEEKQPLEMVRIYREAVSRFPQLKLIMIGDGYMYEAVCDALEGVVKECGLEEGQAVIMRKVPYSEMYSYYLDAKVYINLNKVEILGMSILEALYYETPIVAIKAPGPDFILRDGSEKDYGYIVANVDEVMKKVLKILEKDTSEVRDTLSGKTRIINEFTWGSIAHRLEDIVKR